MNTFFPNNRSLSRRSNNYVNSGNSHYMRQPRNSMNFTDNFVDLNSDIHNSTMFPLSSRNSSISSHRPPHGNSFMMEEKQSFASLFTSHTNLNDHANITTKAIGTPAVDPHESSNDDDGVYLQISNLDQYYDESSLRHFLMNQLKPITPILSLTIETPSIAKVKVPSVQFGKQVVSHLHRKKMGHKRIFVSFMKDKTSAECSALRNKVIGLLRDVPMHQLQMSKFRELFQSRFKSSISILDLYRMPDICTVGINENEEKIITMNMDVASTGNTDVDLVLKTEQHSAPYCIFHFKPDKNKGWAEIEIEPLPKVFMTVSQVQSMIYPLMRMHHGDIPIASILYCLEAELKINVQSNDRGVHFEHLISCIPNVIIHKNDYGIKTLAWCNEDNCDEMANLKTTNMNTSYGDTADHISKEVVELIRNCPKSTMQFSKFIPTYHNHFGKQCRVADYGCTKLIEMFEAMSSIVQVLGEGDSRYITLTHKTQLRRFAGDVLKILRNQPTRSIYLSKLPQAFMSTYNHNLDVTDYGVCDIQDLLDGLKHNSFIAITKSRDNTDDYLLSLQKRRQTGMEFEKTCIFAGEVVELLTNAPQYSIPFRKFVRSYHYYFGYQCKLSDYGYLRLAELLEALSGVVEMDNSNEENRKIFLSRKVALRIFSEQIHEIIRSETGKTGIMVKVDDLLQMHKNKFGYQMQASTLGYDTVIDALKFVPFVELSSYDNELWIVSHLENQKFRQRAMLACITIMDIASKVSLTKFHAAFNEKFKFCIGEKSLHAMKHAVEIEMVNGIKMISLSSAMKFIIHICNVLEQRKVMTVQEIKSTLKLNLTTCFHFGYPNLSSLLQAYPDIFIGSKIGNNLHERSEIKLTDECLYHHNGLQKFLAKSKVQIPDEKPEMYCNNQFNAVGVGRFSNNSFIQNPFQLSYRNNSYAGHADSTMPIRSLPPQQQLQEQRQFENNVSFYERNIRFHQQQQQNQMQALKRDLWNCSIGNSSGFSSANSSYLPDNDLSHHSMLTPFQGPFGRFQDFSPLTPPKPDTPPSTKPISVWFDPVWKCDSNELFGSVGSNSNNGGNNSNSNSYNNNNNPHDSLKSFNVHVVSPFMSFKTMFTFDNINSNKHD